MEGWGFQGVGRCEGLGAVGGAAGAGVDVGAGMRVVGGAGCSDLPMVEEGFAGRSLRDEAFHTGEPGVVRDGADLMVDAAGCVGLDGTVYHRRDLGEVVHWWVVGGVVRDARHLLAVGRYLQWRDRQRTMQVGVAWAWR